MIELFMQSIADLNITKSKILVLVLVCFAVFGFPSAWSLDFFSNQDWVWGVGLIINGLFILIGVGLNNPVKFKASTIDIGSDMTFPSKFFKYAIYTNIVMALFLIYWWLSQDYSATWFDQDGHWDLFGVYSNASTITQWGAVIVVGLLLNGYLYSKFVRNEHRSYH